MSNQQYQPQDQGFNIGGGTDEGIDLSLGLGTVGLDEYEPVPEGVHLFVVVEPPEVQTTQSGEAMLVCKCVVGETRSGQSAVNRHHTERLVIPGMARRQAEPEKWVTMMKMLRRKLEAMTNRPWREDNLKLNPRELSGSEFFATVTHKANQYRDKNSGEVKTGVNAELQNWQSNVAGSNGSPGFGGAQPTANQPVAGAPVNTPPSQNQPGGFKL